MVCTRVFIPICCVFNTQRINKHGPPGTKNLEKIVFGFNLLHCLVKATNWIHIFVRDGFGAT